MANTPVQRPVSSLDPMFAIPQGVDELQYSDVGDSAGVTDLIDDYTGLPLREDVNAEIVFEDDKDNSVEVPDILSIINQTIRRSPGGVNVVDLLVEADNLPNISKYEFRVTKI